MKRTGARGRGPVPAAQSLATRAIHGTKLYPFRGPVSPVIAQTTTYRFADSGDALRYSRATTIPRSPRRRSGSR